MLCGVCGKWRRRVRFDLREKGGLEENSVRSSESVFVSLVWFGLGWFGSMGDGGLEWSEWAGRWRHSICSLIDIAYMEFTTSSCQILFLGVT